MSPSPESTLHVLSEDASLCCRHHFLKASGNAELDAKEAWTCKRCGCEYRAPLAGPVRHWQYNVGVVRW